MNVQNYLMILKGRYFDMKSIIFYLLIILGLNIFIYPKLAKFDNIYQDRFEEINNIYLEHNLSH